MVNCIQKSLLIMPLIIQTATAINLTKLTLKRATVTNNMSSDQKLTINYQKKCPGCPRLHETYTKIMTLAPNQTETIQEEPHIIKNITPVDATKHINLTSHNPENRSVTLTLDDSKKKDFPRVVDFDQALNNDQHFDMLNRGHEDYVRGLPEGVTSEQYFKTLKDLYAKNSTLLKQKHKKKLTRTDYKIPRKLHVVWFGSHPMPEQFKKWQQEWLAKHPGWTLTLWNEDKVKKAFPKLYNQTIFDEAGMMYDYATMSKVVRWEILKRFGGVYIDPDMKCWQSFEPLVKNYHFFAGVGRFYKTFGVCANNVIGSCPYHPLIKSCMEYIKSCETKPGGLYDWTTKNLSQFPLTKAVYEKAGSYSYYKDIIFPRSFFDGNDVEKEFNHTQAPYQAFYEHIQHRPEAFCSRGVWSYLADK